MLSLVDGISNQDDSCLPNSFANPNPIALINAENQDYSFLKPLSTGPIIQQPPSLSIYDSDLDENRQLKLNDLDHSSSFISRKLKQTNLKDFLYPIPTIGDDQSNSKHQPLFVQTDFSNIHEDEDDNGREKEDEECMTIGSKPVSSLSIQSPSPPILKRVEQLTNETANILSHPPSLLTENTLKARHFVHLSILTEDDDGVRHPVGDGMGKIDFDDSLVCPDPPILLPAKLMNEFGKLNKLMNGPIGILLIKVLINE